MSSMTTTAAQDFTCPTCGPYTPVPNVAHRCPRTPRVHLALVERHLHAALAFTDEAAAAGLAWSCIEPLRAQVLSAIDALNHAATDGYTEATPS